MLHCFITGITQLTLTALASGNQNTDESGSGSGSPADAPHENPLGNKGAVLSPGCPRGVLHCTPGERTGGVKVAVCCQLSVAASVLLSSFRQYEKSGDWDPCSSCLQPVVTQCRKPAQACKAHSHLLLVFRLQPPALLRRLCACSSLAPVLLYQRRTKTRYGRTKSMEPGEVAVARALAYFQKGDCPIQRIWRKRHGCKRPGKSKGNKYGKKVRSM